MQNITQLENDLWESADQLRANSRLNQTQYSNPVLGLIFLRHATTRFNLVAAEIAQDLPSRGGKMRALRSDDFTERAAIYLPEKARYDYLVALPESEDIGKAINDAMGLIEEEVELLRGALPKTYTRFEPDLLRTLLRIFNRDALKTASGDVFGRIYEYFLNKFAMNQALPGGEVFTPPSLVRLIVNIIEPDHGIVFDPAVGSAGMFVQTGYFLRDRGTRPAEAVTFYGQEKSDSTVNLARMNMAVHGLEGRVVQGNTVVTS
jgi:type I restriction enzyme M protein